MADNLNIDAGSTLTVATDVIGNVHYQRVKIAHGDDGSAADAGPSAPFPVTVQSATLGTVTIVGNVNVASATLGTVTISGNVNVASATLGTVTVALSSTAVTISNIPHAIVDSGNINISSATLGTVTIAGNVNVASATLGTVTITGSITNSVSTIPILSRTLTGSTGSLTATNGTVSLTPTDRIKVYGFSLTTTSSTEVICIFHTGGLEIWRVTLMAPTGVSAGANLAVTPPASLFQSRTGTAVSLSLSTAVLVHYTTAYFEEA